MLGQERAITTRNSRTRRRCDRRSLTAKNEQAQASFRRDGRPFQLISLTTGGYRPNTTIDFEFRWDGLSPWAQQVLEDDAQRDLQRLAEAGSLIVRAGAHASLLDSFSTIFLLTELGTILATRRGIAEKLYVVQTPSKVIQRCLLMTTDPGDLVLDPTCGSGTTAYVAEQWGRRWITIDTSRVPLALARQRLLTATFPYYELKDEQRGPAGGFVYERKQNKKGEEVGGIVPHVTLKSIANDEPPDEEVLVDRPEVDNRYRARHRPVCGRGHDPDAGGLGRRRRRGLRRASQASDYGSFVDRMLEVLRRSPVLHVGGGKTVQALKNVRPPAKTLSLSAEAPSAVERRERRKPVAFVFGPENGAVSEKLVYEAREEAHLKSYTHLYVIGFAIQPNARELVEKSPRQSGSCRRPTSRRRRT